jgi:iron complex outermembrane receptor protein
LAAAALCALGLSTLPAASRADEAAADAPAAAPEAKTPSDAETVQIEKVVVTSQRRMELLQDVPIAVKAFSAKQIESAGIKSTQDFVNLTPNMSFDNSFTYGNSFVVIRGVTEVNNADSPVAVVVDGVPQNNQKQLKMSLFDIERIEVLKGPQGALYGRNAIGGAINIETKQPSNRLEGFAGLLLGNGAEKELSVGLSGALSDDVALFRVAAQTKKSDGLTRNTYLGSTVDAVDHDNTLRVKLALIPSNAWRMDFRASVTDFKAGATWDSIVPSGNPNEITAPRSNMLGKTFGSTDDFSFKLDADTALGTLTAITGYTDLIERYRGDNDFSNPVDRPQGLFGEGQTGQGMDLKTRMLSQELRLTSPDGQPVRWIAGGYFLYTRRSLETRVFSDLDGTLGQYDDPALQTFLADEDNTNRASAVFGQLDADLRKDLTLSMALRYDRDARRQTDLATGLGTRSASYSAWQPKLTLTEHMSRDTLAYATFSTGFRSGGFNTPGLDAFKPENLSNFEIGSKAMLLDQRLVLNAALFYSHSKDFQYFYVKDNLYQIIANIDRVNIRGLDIDFRYIPIKGLELDGGAGVTLSKIARSDVDPTTIGNYTPKSQPFKATLGIQYAHAVGSGMNASVRFDIEHRSKRYWHPDNAAVTNGMDLVNLRLGLHGERDRWTAELYGRNLGNKRYYADYNAAKYTGLPFDIGSLATGRTFGLEARMRF